MTKFLAGLLTALALLVGNARAVTDIAYIADGSSLYSYDPSTGTTTTLGNCTANYISYLISSALYGLDTSNNLLKISTTDGSTLSTTALSLNGTNVILLGMTNYGLTTDSSGSKFWTWGSTDASTWTLYQFGTNGHLTALYSETAENLSSPAIAATANSGIIDGWNTDWLSYQDISNGTFSHSTTMAQVYALDWRPSNGFLYAICQNGTAVDLCRISSSNGTIVSTLQTNFTFAHGFTWKH